MHSTRRAYVEVSTECMADLGPLMDAGLEVICSAASDRLGIVKLMIAGDVLPEECEASADACVQKLRTVTITMTQETYGRQRLVRVSDIRLA